MNKRNFKEKNVFNKINILYVIAISIGVKDIVIENLIILKKNDIQSYISIAIIAILFMLIVYYIGDFIGVVKLKNRTQYYLLDALGYTSTIYILGKTFF